MKFIQNAFPVIDDSNEHTSEDESCSNVVIDVGTSKILRSKGFFWLSCDPLQMYIWSQAGGLFSMSQGGAWWIDTPSDIWPSDSEEIAGIKLDFDQSDESIGDRRYFSLHFQRI